MSLDRSDTRTRSRRTGQRSAGHVPTTEASRSTRRATPSSSRFRARRVAARGRLELHRAPRGERPDPSPRRHPHGEPFVGPTKLRRARRAPRGAHGRCRHGGQVLLCDRPRCSTTRCSARPRRAPAEGPVRAAAAVPARRGRVSAARRRCTRRTCRSHRRSSSGASARSRTCSSCSAAKMSRS